MPYYGRDENARVVGQLAFPPTDSRAPDAIKREANQHGGRQTVSSTGYVHRIRSRPTGVS